MRSSSFAIVNLTCLSVAGNDISCVPASDMEVQAMVVARNHVAKYLSSSERLSELPPVLDEGSPSCKYCPQKRSCVLYHKGLERGDSSTATSGMCFSELSAHLTPVHLEYFEKWERAIDIEQGATSKDVHLLLINPPAVREAMGKAIAQLQLSSVQMSPCGDGYLYSFKREALPSAHHAEEGAPQQLREDGGEGSNNLPVNVLGEGDYVIVSTTLGDLHMGRGAVKSLNSQILVVHLKQPLQLPPWATLAMRRTHSAIISSLTMQYKEKKEHGMMKDGCAFGKELEALKEVHWVLDKDEKGTTFAKAKRVCCHRQIPCKTCGRCPFANLSNILFPPPFFLSRISSL